MITDRVRLWTSALRSGLFVQATGRLHLKDAEDGSESFCCLGVLSEKAGLESEERGSYESRFYQYGYAGGGDDHYETAMLPAPAGEWLGVTADEGQTAGDLYLDFPDHLWDKDHEETLCEVGLSSLNDAGFTFSQIADLIDYFGIQDRLG